MHRLITEGFRLLPLGGIDGKRPLVKGWASGKLSLSQVLAPMFRCGSCSYGLRLDDFFVLDCDTRDDVVIASLERRFGKPACRVVTPRGLHLWYLKTSRDVPGLKAEGLPVDVKYGQRAYVLGPGSIRPDGGTYAVESGVLTKSVLRAPIIVSNGSTTEIGERHNRLVNEAISMVLHVDNLQELFANLIFIRDEEFDSAREFGKNEVMRIAEWAWTCRLENRVYSGRQSAFKVQRSAIDRLKPLANASDAIALFIVLTDLHGHRDGWTFALKWEAMKRTGHTNLSRARFRSARNALLDTGLLVLSARHQAGTRHQRFRLRSPLHQSVRTDEPKGGGAISYIC